MRLHHKQKISVINSSLHVFLPFMVIGACSDGKMQTQTYPDPYLVEIKCPFKWRNDTIIEACKAKDGRNPIQCNVLGFTSRKLKKVLHKICYAIFESKLNCEKRTSKTIY